MVCSFSMGVYELALVDSGSGVVACPKDYVADVPLLLCEGGNGDMVSVTNDPVKVYGRKNIVYLYENGEEPAIS